MKTIEETSRQERKQKDKRGYKKTREKTRRQEKKLVKKKKTKWTREERSLHARNK